MKIEALLGCSSVLFALGSSGCRCSKHEVAARAEPAALVSAAPSASATNASASAASNVQATTTLPVTPPRGTLPATIVLAADPSEHIGEQLVPLSYFAHRVRGATLFTRGGDFFRLDGQNLVPEGAPEGLGSHDLPGLQGVGPLWLDVDALAGSWPEELWVTTSGMWVSDGARIYSPFSDTYRGSSGSVARVRDPHGAHDSSTVAAWSGGRVLAVEGGAFRALTLGKQPLPKQAAGLSPSCPARVTMRSIAALPSGELYALGGACNENAFLVERWRDDALESKAVDRLPAEFSAPFTQGPQPSGFPERAWLEAAAPNAIYALRSEPNGSRGTARLARFDGTAWQAVSLPIDRSIKAASAAPDGTLWLLMANVVYGFDPAHGWREVTLPAPPPLPKELGQGAPKGQWGLNSLVALGNGRVYLGAHLTYEASQFEASAILSTAPAALRLLEPPDGGAAPARDAGLDAAGATADPSPFGPSCTTPFVVLFSVSAAAPADFAYPATRDALLAASPRPNVKFVEFSFQGRRTLGATAPDAEQANALVRLITERVKGSKPTLVCFSPASVIREVAFPP